MRLGVVMHGAHNGDHDASDNLRAGLQYFVITAYMESHISPWQSSDFPVKRATT